MKNKIIAALGDDKLEHKENIAYPRIYIIDLTRRTDNAQGMMIYDAPQKGIATLLIENPNLDITATFFKQGCFKDENGNELDNCDGVFYLSNSTEETWVLFLEIKDCKATNISDYFKKAKMQVKTTVQIFRNKKIITDSKRVYANISFPRRDKGAFYNQLIKPPEIKEFLDNYNIFILGTNSLKIKNNTTIISA